MMRGDFGTACQDVYVLLIHSYRVLSRPVLPALHVMLAVRRMTGALPLLLALKGAGQGRVVDSFTCLLQRTLS